MKLVGAISTAVLSLTLGVGIPAYAQQEQHDQQEENKDKPSADKEKKAQQEKSAKEEKSAQQQNKNTKQEEKNAQQHETNSKDEKQAQQQHSKEAKPQDEHAGSNGKGRIPEDRFRAHFGQEHRFRVSQADYSNRRFQYGGYSFGFVQPWPSNWLYTQDVYVIEIDGVYYLCNANYPGVNITLSIVL